MSFRDNRGLSDPKPPRAWMAAVVIVLAVVVAAVLFVVYWRAPPGAPLRQLVDSFRQRHPGTQCDLHLQGPLDELGTNIGLALYRIVQEGLANIAMHATATHATVELSLTGDEGEANGRVHILIRDNGSGLLPSAREGLGLTGMRERVRVLGGTLFIHGGPGEGSQIRLAVPVNQV